MDSIASVAVQTSGCILCFIFRTITILSKLHHNTIRLKKDIEKLDARKKDIEDEVRLGEKEGKCPTAQVKEWLRKVEELEAEVQPMLEKADQIASQGCNISSRYQLSRNMAKKSRQVQQLIDSCCFDTVITDKKSFVRAVERQQHGTCLAGQREAEELIDRVMELLKGDDNRRVAVWGTGGVGKTALVRNLNNKLETETETETATSSSLMKELDIVIWVTVSKDFTLAQVQSRIAKRLKLELDGNDSIEERAKRLLKRLTKKRFLLILDEVWEKIDLDIIGVPQSDDETKCKILLTTRSLDVCRAMMTNEEIKLDVLQEEAAWNLFAETVGNDVELPGINPLARAVARECSGLPLALKTVENSMKNRGNVELWKHALRHLQRSAPHLKCIEDEVYLHLKLSYDSLPCKILQSCFLFCALYPESYSIRKTELIQCWISDQLINQNQTQEDRFNDGIALIETLKDYCLLEEGEHSGTVRLHDVVRDVAIWISEKSGFSSTKISFMNTQNLPKQLQRCSDQVTVLFLLGFPCDRIHETFFVKLKKLRVLNLNQSLISSLPPSLNLLHNLRSLLLRDCINIEKLPSLGSLYELQVIDFSGTKLRKLPKGMCNLCNLRELNLSSTHHLETIEAGTISGLRSLEHLDMSFSAYKWEARCNIKDNRAAFDEILTLKKLSVVKLRLDKVDSDGLALDAAWLKGLREFNIQISPRSRDSSYHQPTQNDEKRAILRGVDLMEMGKGLKGLLSTASSLDLVNCGGMNTVSELAVNNGLSDLQNLKSLTILNCDCITNLIRGEIILRRILPNLEHLRLDGLETLTETLGGMVPRRGCLRQLKSIEVENCKKLRSLISFALLQQVKNLEEIRVRNCRRMKCIISGKVSANMIPKLKVIKLRNLGRLRSICSRVLAWPPALDLVEVRNCPLLTRIPFPISNEEKIKGDSQFLNNVAWDDDDDDAEMEYGFHQ